MKRRSMDKAIAAKNETFIASNAPKLAANATITVAGPDGEGLSTAGKPLHDEEIVDVSRNKSSMRNRSSIRDSKIKRRSTIAQGFDAGSSHEEAEIINLYKREYKRFKEENQTWEKLKTEYPEKAKQSAEKLQSVLAASDCRAVLFGNRRSWLVPPPKFKLSIEQVVKDMDDLTKKVSFAAAVIVENRRKRVIVQPPITNNPSSTISSSDDIETLEKQHCTDTSVLMTSLRCGRRSTMSVGTELEISARDLIARAMKAS